jgi:hypothetical protein
VALTLQNPDGTGRTVRLDRAAAAVPTLTRVEPGRPALPRGLGQPRAVLPD